MKNTKIMTVKPAGRNAFTPSLNLFQKVPFPFSDTFSIVADSRNGPVCLYPQTARCTNVATFEHLAPSLGTRAGIVKDELNI